MRRLKRFRKVTTIGLMLVMGVLAAACNLQSRYPAMERLSVQVGTLTETIPPFTPLATLTPSQTLRPPPTFEPPTQTLAPTMTATATLTPTLNLSVDIPGLHGAETPTPSTTPGCQKRDDWTLRYTVQANDALAKIAERYGTYANDLAAANCIRDPNVITIGQELRVPGEAQPVQPAVECVPFELLTPQNGTLAVEGEGTITFNWRGPRAPRNLIRIHTPSGGVVEFVIELRQNETVDLYEKLHEGGTYTWNVYPLDSNFQQVCPEGGPWTFTKTLSPTATVTPSNTPEPNNEPQQPEVIIVTATPTPAPMTGGSDTTGSDTTGSDTTTGG
jgi:LysM repeat protein